MTTDERKKIIKDAQGNGYSYSGGKLINGSSSITFSPTGNSVKVNGYGPLNKPSDVEKSSHYKKK